MSTTSNRAWASAPSPNTPARTAGAGRRGKRLRQLPAKLKLDLDHLAIAEGRVIFIRSVSARGRISLLGQTFQIGRRHKFTYVKTVLDTRRQRLTAYVAGKIFKRWLYKLSRH
jgi:hypothetical protein